MAQSLAHTWGQVVGEVFEETFNAILTDTARNAGVYLDFNGNERDRDCGVRNNRGKLAWQDAAENWHQLDFVYERGGTRERVGVPVAFVEVAWRRYTKHSKNKAQEIEGAILPIAETHRHARPFLGAIVGGVFTKNSLSQLQSRGFSLIYVPYENVMKAFAAVGIDAHYDEDTDEKEYARKLAQFSKLSGSARMKLQEAITESVAPQVQAFTKNLQASVGRKVTRILVLPLHGEPRELTRLEDAISFISTYSEDAPLGELVRYEVEVQFSNGAAIRGEFPTKSEATGFLRTFA